MNIEQKEADQDEFVGKGELQDRATSRKCFMTLTNNWGARIENATLIHQADEGKEQLGPINLDPGQTSERVEVLYVTGSYVHDYWTVEFTASGNNAGTWTNPSFWCDLKKDDDKTTVSAAVDSSSLKLNLPMTSGGCKKSLYKS